MASSLLGLVRGEIVLATLRFLIRKNRTLTWLITQQRLYEIMAQDIIPNFPEEEQKEWNDAAYNWRLPFWDWAIANEDSATGTVKVPKLSKYPTITVPTADGKGTERIDNPLFQFKMPNNRPMRDHGVQSFVDPWGLPDELDVSFPPRNEMFQRLINGSTAEQSVPVGIPMMRMPASRLSKPLTRKTRLCGRRLRPGSMV